MYSCSLRLIMYNKIKVFEYNERFSFPNCHQKLKYLKRIKYQEAHQQFMLMCINQEGNLKSLMMNLCMIVLHQMKIT